MRVLKFLWIQNSSKESSKKFKKRSKGDTKIKEDGTNLSLHSYEDTDEANEKYYSEQELSHNILGITQNSTDKENNKDLKNTNNNQKLNSNTPDLPSNFNIFKSGIPSPDKEASSQEILSDDDSYEYIVDKEILDYIESLRDKFDLDSIQTTKEFIDRINQELDSPELTEKQFYALQELK